VPIAVGLVVAGGLAALYASRAESRGLYVLAKAAAGCGFVLVTLASGTPAGTASRLIVVGLMLAVAGDVALALRGTPAFFVGMGAFALTHALYSLAFIVRGFSLVGLALAATAVAAAASGAWRWLGSRLPHRMKAPVAVYMAFGGTMVALSWASFGAGGSLSAGVGASAFYLSDLAVARERFVSLRPADKLWGLPLYYLGQILIALSV
jgi:uncharacterized membrane protein YhhN